MAKRYQRGKHKASSVLLRLMPSDYPFAICWPLYRLSYFDKCLLITPLLYVGHCIFRPTSINAFWLSLSYMLAIVSSVLLRFMPSDCHIGIFWPLYRLSYFNVCLLITPLVSFGHCIVCPTLICAFWLPLWYLLAIVSSVLLWLSRTDDTMAKRYQRGNQKAYIEVGQTIQWQKDTKWVIRRHTLK
jgi:hypothetical protein